MEEILNTEQILNIILNAGDAKNNALEASDFAAEGKFEKAEQMLERATEALNKAHEIQFDMMKEEASGNRQELSLLIVHAQDYLMSAMTIIDLIKANIKLWSFLYSEKMDGKEKEGE